jgi:DNA-binding CsgD family transcriptional regulator
MRVKVGAAGQIQETPSEQTAGEDLQSQLVDVPGTVLCSGTSARRFLAGMKAETRDRLLESISDRLQKDVSPVLIERDDEHRVIAFKVAEAKTIRDAAAIALADLYDIPVPSEHVLQRVFDLTPAEVRLAQGLARGDSLEEVAAAVGIKITTARTQLAAIFAKTRTRRQAKLVALLGRLAQLGS